MNELLKNTILNELKSRLSEKELSNIKDKNLHLAIFTNPCLEYMLEGKKKVESRFSKNKIVPYNKIEKEDIVIVKKSGGEVVAYFTIKDILFFNLEQTNISEIRKKYEKELCVDEEFWKKKETSRYASLIFIDKLYKLDSFKISKKGMQTWIKL